VYDKAHSRVTKYASSSPTTTTTTTTVDDASLPSSSPLHHHHHCVDTCHHCSHALFTITTTPNEPTEWNAAQMMQSASFGPYVSFCFVLFLFL
jgi:hypothetical protein